MKANLSMGAILLLLLGLAACSPPKEQAGADGKRFEEIKAKAEKGDAHAQFHLGDCYRKGEGAPRDASEAVKWYRKAADQGYAWAQYNLAVSYGNGEGVAKYEVEAYKWNLLAAAQGDDKAKRNASLLELLLSQEELAEGKRQAQDWLEQRKKSPGNNQ